MLGKAGALLIVIGAGLISLRARAGAATAERPAAPAPRPDEAPVDLHRAAVLAALEEDGR